MNGTELIAAERRRQVEQEGFGAEHDAQHWLRHLAAAAACYEAAQGPRTRMSLNWPWGREWWKPKTRERNLVRAGALYLAAAEAFARRKPAAASNPDSYGASLRFKAEQCAQALDELAALDPVSPTR